jgi:hypothetical protein
MDLSKLSQQPCVRFPNGSANRTRPYFGGGRLQAGNSNQHDPAREIEWRFAACDLKGTVRPGVGGEPASFDIVGTGRPGTNSAGKEYHYQGHRARSWTNAVDQRPALVGSIFSRAKPNRAIEESIPLPEELMGTGYPFIAVKQQI